jgi:IclR family KDG regulon transcriptional repressor
MAITDGALAGRSSLVMFGRAMAIIEAVSASRTPVGVSALGRRTSIPKTTTHRLLEILATYGMVERQGPGFVPGPGLRNLARDAAGPGVDELRVLLMPYLVELYEQTGDVVTLGVLDGPDVVVVEVLRGRRHAPLVAPETRIPAHCSAIGKLLLAGQHHVSAALDPARLTACTPHSITTRPALDADLRRIRALGMATAHEEHLLGVVELALPVSDGEGPVAGIARSRPAADPFDDDRSLTAHRAITSAASSAVRHHARTGRAAS